MFDLLKKDVNIGDKVKLYLTTGKEPQGTVLAIGENFILIQADDKTQNRFFDKLIGGWDLIQTSDLTANIYPINSPTKPNVSPVAKKTANKIGEIRKGQDVFKLTIKEIDELVKLSEFEQALNKIDNELQGKSIDNKRKSILLLKKAQMYSSLNNPDASEKAYQELVSFNEKTNASPNNLSHLYTELARLQSLKIEKQRQALESVKKALHYNPNNNFARNLIRQFEGKTNRQEIDDLKGETQQDHLLIDSEEDSTAISRMLDLDVKEYKYSHPEIIRNGGRPTAFIAKLILEEAKQTKEGGLSEKYPIYLEAAKAFSELNVGSYDLQDYLESVAYYSMLKGNSLFTSFRNRIFNNEIDKVKLKRTRDSACSYYIESLNLLSNIEPRFLLTILANYLKLNIAIYHLEENSQIDLKLIFKGQFADVFTSCLRNKNHEIEKIAYSTILSVGASSIFAWNELGKLDKGTSRLYLEFKINTNRKRIYNLLNEINHSFIDVTLDPKGYLKNLFLYKKRKENELQDLINKISEIDFEPRTYAEIQTLYSTLNDYNYIFSDTDKETKDEIGRLLLIILPYLNRGQSERTNILIQARNIFERQIKFIIDNTTFYGRAFFYGLLHKWKKHVDLLLQEKIAKSYPLLIVSIDPPYYIETNGEITAPLVIKNEGEATAEGFHLDIHYEATEYVDTVDIPHARQVEIASEGKIQSNLVIPKELLQDSKAVEIKIEISPFYQGKKLSSTTFEFTIEEEPESTLTYEDIPWRDGPIPSEDLFKGRKKLIADLSQHYLSVEKDKPYILYGLTRTGKSSILEYLSKDLEGETFTLKGKEMTVLTFSWDLSVAASFKKASDFWEYTLYQKTFEELEKFSDKYSFDLKGFDIKENARAKDFKTILDFMASKKLYPIFFIDEFSFIKTLIDDSTLNAAFLHTLRQFSLSDMASFIFAGTYDIKSLIKDPRYGITGQLVNAIEAQVNEINDNSASELIEVINNKLSFTPEAVNHIKFLSGNVPYFIQIICKYCGYYAAENKRRYIGYPELEKVVRILIGQEPSSDKSLVKKLPENTFQNNQYSPADPREVSVLISCIAHFNKDRIDDPRGVGFSELQKLWAEKKITAFRQKLADAINLLKEKKILIQEEDENIPVYKFSVDLFRRWWTNHHTDINLILTTLID